MDIKVGESPTIGRPADKLPGTDGAVEARVLAVRAPRKRALGLPSSREDRRARSADRDPLTGRVLVLLIPDGSRLPAGLERGAYRVFLRFARR